MLVPVLTLGGSVVTTLDVDLASASLDDVRSQLVDLVGGAADLRRARVYHGATELRPGRSLSDFGVAEGSHLTVVITAAMRIVTASSDGSAKIWRQDADECLQTLKSDGVQGNMILPGCMPGTGREVRSATFSPDGKLVLTASADCTAALWTAQSGEQLHTLKGHVGALTSAVFSPDSTLVLTASEDYTAKLWSTESGQCLRTLRGHQFELRSAVFSPDGACVLTASIDRTAKVWSVQSGNCLQTLEGHRWELSSAAFSQDGALAITTSQDRTAKI